MQLLVAVINQEEKLDEILSGFLELGITGATILNSEGMGRVLSHDIPIFAGLETLVTRSRPQNQTIFSVIEDPEKDDRALAMLHEICGDFNDPATGIAFVVPISRAVGLAPERGEDDPEVRPPFSPRPCSGSPGLRRPGPSGSCSSRSSGSPSESRPSRCSEPARGSCERWRARSRRSRRKPSRSSSARPGSP